MLDRPSLRRLKDHRYLVARHGYHAPLEQRLDVAGRALASPADEDAAAAGARETFARLIDWLALHERPLARRVAS